MTKKQREKFYDKQIAPKLLEVRKLCEENGMPFVATVEFNPAEGLGWTVFLEEHQSAAINLAYLGAKCAGNADKLIMAMLKRADEVGHGSAYLSILGNKNIVQTGSAAVALTVTNP